MASSAPAATATRSCGRSSPATTSSGMRSPTSMNRSRSGMPSRWPPISSKPDGHPSPRRRLCRVQRMRHPVEQHDPDGCDVCRTGVERGSADLRRADQVLRLSVGTVRTLRAGRHEECARRQAALRGWNPISPETYVTDRRGTARAPVRLAGLACRWRCPYSASVTSAIGFRRRRSRRAYHSDPRRRAPLFGFVPAPAGFGARSPVLPRAGRGTRRWGRLERRGGGGRSGPVRVSGRQGGPATFPVKSFCSALQSPGAWNEAGLPGVRGL